MIINPKGIVMIDRRTGNPVGPAIPLKPSDNFYRLPRLDQRVWRYMDLWKFESLVKEKALYFRRSDKLEDDMEGKYAEANRTYTTTVWQRFIQAYSIQHDTSAHENGALDFRYRIFLSCWHINDTENPDMWQRYTKSNNSIVVVSTVRKLVKAFSQYDIQPGRVKYAYHAVPRPEWSHFAPFFFKDISFMGEREFRLITWLPEDQPILIETKVGLNLSIEPSAVIDLVKLHPNSLSDFRDRVKAFLATQNVTLQVNRSTLPPLPRK
jgi:hypothetical protein